MVDMVGAQARTVLGDVGVADLGHTQPHEHVLCDMSGVLQPWGVRPVAERHVDSAHGVVAEMPVTARELAEQPIRLDNYDAVRREVYNIDNLRLRSHRDAVDELSRYAAAGGGCVVDSTVTGLGRDPRGLARVSRGAGVHIVMGSGYYTRPYHPPGLDDVAAEELCDEIVSDVVDGVGVTGIRAGIIGEIGLSWPVHPTEEKVLQAACAAQVRTGAALQIHPGRHRMAPAHAMELVLRHGGDPKRTIMSHVDRTLWEIAEIVALGRTGCYVELDLFGQESSYYAFNPDARRPNDRTRIDWIMALIEAGLGKQVLVAQDICQKVYLSRYGGPGYTHILDNAIPLMRRMGMSDDDVRSLTEHNPARALAITESGR